MRFMPRYAIAAIVAAAIILAVMIFPKTPDFGASFAFADVQQAIRQIKTAIVEMEVAGTPAAHQKTYIARDRDFYRVESGDGQITFMLDCTTGKIVVLDHKNKTAQISKDESLKSDSNSSYAAAANQSLDNIAILAQKAAEPVGTREIDGQTLVGFRLRGHDADETGMKMLVWVDPKTHFPVLTEIWTTDPNDPEVETIHTKIRYKLNVPLDDSLFKLDVPQGYKVIETPDKPPRYEESTSAPNEK